MSQAWNPSAGSGEDEEKRIGNLLGVLHTLGTLAPKMQRQEDGRLSPSEKAQTPGSRRDPGAKKRMTDVLAWPLFQQIGVCAHTHVHTLTQAHAHSRMHTHTNK